MANKMALGLVIGGAVSSTVGAAFRDVENRVKTLSDKGKKARVLQSTIGETMRLRDEWKKAHDAGEKGAAGLLRRLENNLTVLRKEGVEVGRLAREYDRLGRAGRSAELQAKGRHQLDQGKQGLRNGITQATVGAGLVAIPTKISADYQAIIRDIAIKAGVAKTDQEAQMSRRVIQTSQDVGILDKNLAERRDTSSQKWSETIQAGNDALRSVGDAIRPVTDALASGLTTVAKGFTKLSDESPNVVMGITALAAGASVVTSVLGALKIGRGVVNLARGGSGGGAAGADEDGKGGAVRSLVAAGLSAVLGRKEGEAADKTGIDPVETGLQLLDVIREAKQGDEGGGSSGPDHTQKVFVVNARDLGGPGAGGGGRRARRRPGPTPPPPSPPSARLGFRDVVGTVGKLGKALPGEAVIEAGLKAFETLNTAKTDDEKGEGYGAAAGGLAGTMAGAAAGAAIGSVVPILGTAVGGMVGAMLGAMGGESLGSMLGKSAFAKSLFGSESAPGDVVRSMTAQAGPPSPPSPLLLKPEIKPAAIEQKITFAPHMPITIEGDVKDPAELTRQLDAMLQNRFRDFSRELEDSARRANDRQLFDSPHVG